MGPCVRSDDEEMDETRLKAMLTEAKTYDELYNNFRWDIPARFNMATACCDRHADGSGRLALVYVDEDGGTTRTRSTRSPTFSRRFANVLKADGLDARRPRRGVFVAIPRIADRASRRVSFRPDLDPAVRAVRRGRAGIPAGEFGGEGHHHRRSRVGEADENPRAVALSEDIYITGNAAMPAPSRSGRRSKLLPKNLPPSIHHATIPP